MKRPGRVRVLALSALAALLGAAAAPATVRVQGSTTVNPVVVEAAAALTRETGIRILVDTAGGSSGGIAALADGRAEVAMSSRPVSADDRKRYPRTRFEPVAIGVDALALVVSRDLWEGGVRSLDREAAAALYEGRVSNWRQLGGPDRRVVFFNKEPGRGTWEVFAGWLYGDAAAAPLVSLPEVGSNEEARSKVASMPGAITQLSAAWADGQRVFALALRGAGGAPISPDAEAVAAGRYPLARRLWLITDGPARGEAARLLEFVLGPRGQELVRRHGYLPLAAGGAREAP